VGEAPAEQLALHVRCAVVKPCPDTGLDDLRERLLADAGAGDVQIAPVTDGRLALFPGWRNIGQTREGIVYPLDPADWLAHACSIVRRDLTEAEWNAHLPGRPYRPTCG